MTDQNLFQYKIQNHWKKLCSYILTIFGLISLCLTSELVHGHSRTHRGKYSVPDYPSTFYTSQDYSTHMRDSMAYDDVIRDFPRHLRDIHDKGPRQFVKEVSSDFRSLKNLVEQVVEDMRNG